MDGLLSKERSQARAFSENDLLQEKGLTANV